MISVKREDIEAAYRLLLKHDAHAATQETDKATEILQRILLENPDEDYSLSLSNYEISMALIRHKRWTLEILDMLIRDEERKTTGLGSGISTLLQVDAEALKAKLVGENEDNN